MKKGLKILCLIVALIAVFLLGWRLMPRVWPGIKEAIVYPVFPQMRPAAAPAPTQEPYLPKSSAAFGDPVGETDSLIYYFYKDYCPWCRELEPLTAGLPRQIILPDGTASAAKLVCLHNAEEPMLQVITDYYEKYQIPEEKQYVPAMVIGDKYLFAGEEIVPGLLEALTAGDGLKTPLLDGNERVK